MTLMMVYSGIAIDDAVYSSHPACMPSPLGFLTKRAVATAFFDSARMFASAKERSLLLAFIAPLLFIALLCAAPGVAYATQPLTVYVGYSGGPYYEKCVYTEAELEALADSCYYAYSAIDNKPSLVKYVAWGVTLETLFENSVDSVVGTSVNVEALWRLAFDTDDDYKPDDGIYGNNVWYWNYYSGYQSGKVLNPAVSPRYYFSAFDECFDFDLTSIISSKEDELVASGSLVPSMIALKYVKTRIESAEEWNNLDAVLSDTNIPSGLSAIGTVDERNRLLFGQTSPDEQEVSNEVHSITGLYCIYQGTPTITLSETQITGAIGESITVSVTIEAADDLIETLGPADVVWESSDTSRATVKSNGDGTATVTIRGKGDVEITATFGNSSSSNFVTSTSMTVSGPGGSGWREEGEGTGWEYGDGDGEQGPGTGSGSNGDEDSGDGDDGDDGDGDDGEEGLGSSDGSDDQDDESSSSDDGDGESSGETEEDDSDDSESSEGAEEDSSVSDDDSSQEPASTYTSPPDNARSVVISPSFLESAAEGSQSAGVDTSEEGASAGATSDNLEDSLTEQDENLLEQDETEVIDEDTRIYAITESSEEEELADNRQIYWECIVAILALMALSAVAQVMYFRHSLDRSVPNKISRSNSRSNAPPTGRWAATTS